MSITPTTRNSSATQQEDAMAFESTLGQAVAVWRTGRNISLVLAAKLMAEGYDVPALERRHRP